MAVWLKLCVGLAAGSAGLLLIAMRMARENETALEHTIKRELEGLRQHLFDR